MDELDIIHLESQTFWHFSVRCAFSCRKIKLSYVKCQRKTLLMNKLNTFAVTANAIKFYQSNLGVLCHYINEFQKDRH